MPTYGIRTRLRRPDGASYRCSMATLDRSRLASLLAAEQATGRPFEPVTQDDAFADEARGRQVRRLVKR